MTIKAKKTRTRVRQKQAQNVNTQRKSVAASRVGLSLTISEKAIKEFDRIQQEKSEATEAGQIFSWR